MRYFNHAIEVDEHETLPNQPLFKLSPAELAAAKEYVVELMKRVDIRPR